MKGRDGNEGCGMHAIGKKTAAGIKKSGERKDKRNKRRDHDTTNNTKQNIRHKGQTENKRGEKTRCTRQREMQQK